MRGITPKKKLESQEKYERIYAMWQKDESTLQEIGSCFDLTKQRVWQIITRCKLGDGDYYDGMQLARQKWSELNELYTDFEDIIPEYNKWLNEQGVKTARNNQTVVPHRGWGWKY